MAEVRRDKRKRNQNGAIAVIGTLFLMILLSTVLLFLPEEKPKKKNPGTVTATVAPTGAATSETAEEAELLAVVLDVDTEIKMLTVYNVEKEEEQKLVYIGATTFYDGY